MGDVITVADCTVSWKAESQDMVALSMTEVEYMDVVDESKEALRLRGLIETFGIIQNSVRVYSDSHGVIHLAKNHRYHKRMKHIDVRYHKIRQGS